MPSFAIGLSNSGLLSVFQAQQGSTHWIQAKWGTVSSRDPLRMAELLAILAAALFCSTACSEQRALRDGNSASLLVGFCGLASNPSTTSSCSKQSLPCAALEKFLRFSSVEDM